MRNELPRFHLYVDDSGSRYSDKPQAQRADGMDYFALGGILIAEEDIGQVIEKHISFLGRWNLTSPLHSTKIRGGRGAFSFLSDDKDKADAFFSELNDFILQSPIVSISCVIDRPGYVSRYAEKHEEPWLLCQTAFAILVERACKFARARDAKLEIFFEESGKKEDRCILGYMKDLKSVGMPFPGSGAAGYESLAPEDFRATVAGSPNRVTKRVPMIQIADLVLYAMARGGYDNTYAPYVDLYQHKRIIDALIDEGQIATHGVKYSCFDTKKARD